jgi:capsular polysaccharide biosynthesis protein/Mrp family chromosome partitioning ATPase
MFPAHALPDAQETDVTAGTSLDDLSATPRSAGQTRSALRWYVACGLVGALIGGGIAYAVTPLLPTTYTTSSQIVVRSPGDVALFGSAGGGNANLNSSTAAQILRSPEVNNATSDLLDGRLTPGQVAAQVAIDPVSNSTVINIEAQASTPALAQELANAIPQAYATVEAQAYRQRADEATQVLSTLRDNQQQRLDDVQKQLTDKVTFVTGLSGNIANPTERANWIQSTLETDVDYQRLQNEAVAITQSINDTNDTIQQSTANFAILESGVDRVITAERPESAVKSPNLQNLAAGVVAGLLIGLAVAYAAIERRRVIDPASAAMTLGAPLLGTISKDRRLRKLPGLADLSEDTRLGNELKVLSSSLVLSARRRGLGSVVVTSAHRREGKSVLTRNLAAAAEYIGQPVALVDTGFGHPTTTEIFDLVDSPGLAEVLEGGPLSQVLHYISFGEGGRVPVVPVGLNGFATEPGRRLNEHRRGNWARLFNGFDSLTALVDAPAVNDHPLALQLAAAGGLVVIASPRTTLADLEVIRNRADVSDVPVLGFIVNENRNGRRSKAGKPSRKAPSSLNVVIDMPDHVEAR